MESGIDLGPLIFAGALVFIGLLLWLIGSEEKRHTQIAEGAAQRRYRLLIRAYRVLEMYCPHDPLVDEIEKELDWEFVDGRT